MKTRLYLFTLTVLMLLCNTRPALSQQLNFSLVPPSVESPSVLVTGITQDKSGLMWFSTQNGVQRYDGYKITSYLNELRNQNSIAVTVTECIYADSAGIIWIGTTGAGLDRLDPVTGKFTHYRHNPNNPASIVNDSVKVIFEDHEGIFWIGTLRGLDKFDPKTGKFKHYRSDKNDITTLSHNHVRAIYEDRHGTLWIGTGSAWGDGTLPGEGGLNRFDKNTGKFTRYMHDPKDPHSLVDNRVRAICEDSHGNFWVGTAGDGLHLMDREKGTFQRLLYDPKHPEKPSRPPLNPSTYSGAVDHITFIREDATGALWIGSMNGVNRYDPKSQKTTYYGGKNGPDELKDNESFYSYMSRDGVIWISYWGGNIYHTDPSPTIIPLVNTTTQVWSFYQDDPQILWTGTNSGLVQNNLATGTKKIFKHDPLVASSIGCDSIYHIASDHQGGLWVATWGGGLNRYNPVSQTFLQYRHNAKDNRSLDNDNVYCILEDHTKNLWAGTDSGLNMLDSRSGYFTHFQNNPSDSNSLSSSNGVFTLVEDNDQNYLWVGTFGGGINRLNRQSGKFEHFMPGSLIYSIIKDHEGIIWIAAANGLFMYNRKNNIFEKYTDPYGYIKISDAEGIAEDSQNNLWLATSKGILRINKNRNQILVFNKNNGIRNTNFFNSPSVFKDVNGKLYFSFYPDGYYCFLPDSLSKKEAVPLVLIEDFRLGYESAQPGKGSPLSVPFNEATKINLSHNQNVFSFDFAPINYTSTEDNRVVFKLENYDEDWRKADAEKTVQYFNVPPGRYIFRVKAATNIGAWTEKQIVVNIAPPWWLTWWAYCIYGLLMLALVYSLHRIQKQRVINAERERTREREFAQAKEIEKAYHELKTTQQQLIQSEKMASLGELTAGIAHEIQNPLNFVNNFSEVNTELIDEASLAIKTGNQNEALELMSNLRENEQKINHHGKRADAIVKGMLQHSRSSNGVKESTNINALCDEYLRLSYFGLRAKDKSFNATMKTDFDESIGSIKIIPQDIGRVVLNLINNAFYSVDEKKKSGIENYEPAVSISTKKTYDNVLIVVKDNGPGIPQKIIDKIFNPFFTTKPTGQGTGLGLSLSYDIVKAYGGEIKVESKQGEGCEFTIQLPTV